MKNRKMAKFISFLTVFTMFFAFFSMRCSCDMNIVFAEDNINCSAKAMAVIEKTSGRLLYSKNENEKLPMASLTKIITAIYVIENCIDFDIKHEIPIDAVGIEGTSVGLKAGEHLSVRELLYGLMLRSGNDCAVALALIISGSETLFVKNVNLWLKEKGFNDTQIRNPHGLHHEDHFTTAYDLAKITAYALSSDLFQEIVSTKQKQISNELKSNISRNLKNKNRLLNDFEFADGVKTGYTKKAGRCFVGSATKEDMQVVCVLLNCVPMFEECENLLKKSFEEFSMEKIISKGDIIGSVKVADSKNKNCVVSVQNEFYYPLKKNEKKDIVVKFTAKENVCAPVNIGDELASVEISLENQLIFLDKIYSIRYIEADTFNSKFQRVIENM